MVAVIGIFEVSVNPPFAGTSLSEMLCLPPDLVAIVPVVPSANAEVRSM
jgi:hypothetical protein